jgi:hypothetical protein
MHQRGHHIRERYRRRRKVRLRDVIFGYREYQLGLKYLRSAHFSTIRLGTPSASGIFVTMESDPQPIL